MTVQIGLWLKWFFFRVTQWRKIGREELKFLFYKTLLADFSTTTDNSPTPPPLPVPPVQEYNSNLFLSWTGNVLFLLSQLHTYCCWQGGTSRRGFPRPSPGSSSRRSDWRPPQSLCCKTDSRLLEARTSGNSCPRGCLRNNRGAQSGPRYGETPSGRHLQDCVQEFAHWRGGIILTPCTIQSLAFKRLESTIRNGDRWWSLEITDHFPYIRGISNAVRHSVFGGTLDISNNVNTRKLGLIHLYLEFVKRWKHM